jgi:hypothetical protein
VNYFKGSGACGLSASPLYKNIDVSVATEILNRNKKIKLDAAKCGTQNNNKQRAAIFTD